MWGLSITHWLVVALVATLLLGKGKVSALMKDLGGGLREFKNGLQAAIDDSEPAPTPRKLEKKDD